MAYEYQGYGGPRDDLPPGWIERWDERRQCPFYINERTGEETLERPAYGRPPLPPGWIERWDERRQCPFYINEQNGEETLERPVIYYEEGYGGPPPRDYAAPLPPPPQQQQRSEGHGMRNGMIGAAAGLVGGALLMHEGEKFEDGFERDKYRVEEDVEDFPDNAARWTGDKVVEVEDIPQDVEYDVDRVEYRTEERYDDRIEDAYDQGRDDGRDDRIEDAYDQGREDGREEGDW